MAAFLFSVETFPETSLWISFVCICILCTFANFFCENQKFNNQYFIK